MSIIDFMNNMDNILSGKNTLRCPKCGSDNVRVDQVMEKYNEDLGRTYYECKCCGEKFTA